VRVCASALGRGDTRPQRHHPDDDGRKVAGIVEASSQGVGPVYAPVRNIPRLKGGQFESTKAKEQSREVDSVSLFRYRRKRADLRQPRKRLGGEGSQFAAISPIRATAKPGAGEAASRSEKEKGRSPILTRPSSSGLLSEGCYKKHSAAFRKRGGALMPSILNNKDASSFYFNPS